jgi:hypothetical protein
MADIELVIKISEKAYNALTHTEFDANLVVDEMRKSIVDGTPLPKGHGRIIDESQVMVTFTWDNGYIDCYAPTIIEADKESEE